MTFTVARSGRVAVHSGKVRCLCLSWRVALAVFGAALAQAQVVRVGTCTDLHSIWTQVKEKV